MILLAILFTPEMVNYKPLYHNVFILYKTLYTRFSFYKPHCAGQAPKRKKASQEKSACPARSVNIQKLHQLQSTVPQCFYIIQNAVQICIYTTTLYCRIEGENRR
jgi:hypothetical protein